MGLSVNLNCFWLCHVGKLARWCSGFKKDRSLKIMLYNESFAKVWWSGRLAENVMRRIRTYPGQSVTYKTLLKHSKIPDWNANCRQWHFNAAYFVARPNFITSNNQLRLLTLATHFRCLKCKTAHDGHTNVFFGACCMGSDHKHLPTALTEKT